MQAFGFEPSKKRQEWELAAKARSLCKTAQGAALAALVLEAILLARMGETSEPKDGLLADAAELYKVDVRALRREMDKAERLKMLKLKTATCKNCGSVTPTRMSLTDTQNS